MKFKSNIVRLINVTLLLLCSYFILEYISSLKVEAIKITLPKILNRIIGRTGSYDLKHEEQKSIPKGNICMNLGRLYDNFNMYSLIGIASIQLQWKYSIFIG